jgi:hypothetical protein
VGFSIESRLLRRWGYGKKYTGFGSLKTRSRRFRSVVSRRFGGRPLMKKIATPGSRARFASCSVGPSAFDRPSACQARSPHGLFDIARAVDDAAHPLAL